MENYQNLIDDLSVNRKEWKIENDTLSRIIKDGTWEHTYRISYSTYSPRLAIRSENKDNYRESFSHDIKPGFLDRQKIIVAVKKWRSLFVSDVFGRLGKKAEA